MHTCPVASHFYPNCCWRSKHPDQHVCNDRPSYLKVQVPFPVFSDYRSSNGAKDSKAVLKNKNYTYIQIIKPQRLGDTRLKIRPLKQLHRWAGESDTVNHERWAPIGYWHETLLNYFLIISITRDHLCSVIAESLTLVGAISKNYNTNYKKAILNPKG